MNEQNLKYIANLKVQDVPWSRLTTAYGRASGFPKIFEKLARAIEACDAARGLGGEQNLKSKPGAGQNLKSKSGCGKNSTDATRCGAAQNSINLAQKSESKFQKADNEAAKFKAGGETELKTGTAKCGEAESKSADGAAIKFKASQASKFKTSAADKSSDASEREKFDAKALQNALDKIFNEIEHQSTLWHEPLLRCCFWRASLCRRALRRTKTRIKIIKTLRQTKSVEIIRMRRIEMRIKAGKMMQRALSRLGSADFLRL
ncbi:hypothetical protein [uncultured Campylobacter sp.]|uniref:hypothetical protein n=1 Tax=uncultured Campylobacter sp. TaxID=218934 RepID=UPI00263118AE|nr:hypothetical protein [uncultured Campylobacter sp.]